MKVLVDTCVLSEIVKARADPRVLKQLRAIGRAGSYMSVISVGEITIGIERLPPSRKRSNLEAWLRELEQDFAEQILSVDLEIARIWGEITAKASAQGVAIPPADGLIAATALRHGLHVMTRNSADFQATGALIIDPWQ